MQHRNQFNLKIGGVELELHKSKKFGAIQYIDPITSPAADFQLGIAKTNPKIGSFILYEFPEDRMENEIDLQRRNETVAISTHTYITTDEQKPFIPTGLINIRLAKQDSEKAALDYILKEYGLEYISRYIEGSHNVRVTKQSDNPMKVAEKLQELDIIQIAEPELASKATLANFLTPNDRWIKYQWHLRNVGRVRGYTISGSFVPGADARVMEAWAKYQTLGDPSVKVAVYDNGFDLTHPDLSRPDKVVNPWNFVDGTPFPRYPTQSEQATDSDSDGVNPGHGTACAGLAVGDANNSGKIAGVAPNCKLMPIRFNFILSFTELDKQLQHAIKYKADVISCSWQQTNPNHVLNDCTKRLLKQMADEGIAICIAAGNKNKNINAPDGSYFNGFANDESVISVSAVDYKNQWFVGSNYGENITVCAPAGTATSDIVGRHGIRQSDYVKNFGYTSCATPIVAGVCALIKSLNPGLTGHQVKEIIARSARRIEPHEKNKLWTGHGCINALKAMDLTMSEFNGVM